MNSGKRRKALNCFYPDKYYCKNLIVLPREKELIEKADLPH